MITLDEIADEIGDEMSVNTDYLGEVFLRFMSLDEWYLLREYRVLTNNTNHSRYCKTGSKGFCFLRIGDDWFEGAETETETDAVNSAYRFLSGIVSEDVAVVFVNDGAAIRHSVACYADPFGSYYDCIAVDEYYTNEYDRDTMVPVRTYFNNDGRWLLG